MTTTNTKVTEKDLDDALIEVGRLTAKLDVAYYGILDNGKKVTICTNLVKKQQVDFLEHAIKRAREIADGKIKPFRSLEVSAND